jgi:ABC-type branched-subunit amino acid transport system permease subunit
MRLYTIHQGPPDKDGDPRLAAIKEGFSWPALLFTVLWSLWHGMWLVTVVVAAIQLVLGWLIVRFGADPVTDAVLNLAINVILGLVGNDLRRWTLAGRGYDEAAIVAAPDGETALYMYLSGQTAEATPAPETSGGAAAPLLPPAAPEPVVRP